MALSYIIVRIIESRLRLLLQLGFFGGASPPQARYYAEQDDATDDDPSLSE
jgi:hypothetical protein